MTIAEFNTATGELEKYFEKDLNNEQRRVWYDEFKNIELNEYTRIINLARRECKFLPKLVDLLEIKNRQAPQEIKREEYVEVHCDKCRNTGLIPYEKIENDIKGIYYALCTCENTKRIPQGLKSRLRTAQELNL